MAYKIQFGATTMAGNLSYANGDLQTVGAAGQGNRPVTGSTITCSGEANAADDLKLQSSANLTAGSMTHKSGSLEYCITSAANSRGKIKLQCHDGSALLTQAEIGKDDQNYGQFVLYDNDSAVFSMNGQGNIVFKGTDVGSAANGDLDVQGNCTITGNLIVNGDDAIFNTTNWQSDAATTQLAKGATDHASSNNSGVLFGPAHNTNGALLNYVNDSTQQLQCKQGSSAAFIKCYASAFYAADSSGLTSPATLPVASAKYTVAGSNLSDGDTVAVGLNTVGSLSGGSITVSMNATEPTAGTVHIIKSINANVEPGNHLTINCADANGRIDGQTSIRLESGFAAVEIIYLGNLDLGDGNGTKQQYIIV